MAVIAFIGLGQMGQPMSLNLLKGGHRLQVFDVSQAAVERLVEAGASACATPADAARGAEFVITMLPTASSSSRCCSGKTASRRRSVVMRW